MATYIPSNHKEIHDFVVYRDIRIPMRDGINLVADISFPSVNGVVDFRKSYPVVLSRTPYMDIGLISYPNHMAYFLAERGFVYVCNAVRGTYHSEGILEPMVNEGWGCLNAEHGGNCDGVDTLRWIAQQPWCNGKIATCGKSYVGGTQYLPLLTNEVPELVTSIIDCPAVNSYKNGFVYQQDFLDANIVPWWPISQALLPNSFRRFGSETKKNIQKDLSELGYPSDEQLADEDYLEQLRRKYTLRNFPVVRWLDYYQKWLDNRENALYFAYDNTEDKKHDFSHPILFETGWFDLFSMNVLDGYRNAVRDTTDKSVAAAHRLIVGAWGHDQPNPKVRKIPESETDDRLFQMEWFEKHIKDEDNSLSIEYPVSIFVMGENRWRNEKCWPLDDTVETEFYLHSSGNANTRLGNGSLTKQKAENEPDDRFVSDPSNPVLSRGGNGIICGGQIEQSELELRYDVLVYTSEVIDKPIEVTGYVNACVYLSVSTEDADLFVKLVDVFPDGSRYNVIAGGRRGRYIQNGREDPQPLMPGIVYRFDVQMRATSYVFQKGHRIGVEIMGSDSLHADVNPNSFVDLNSCTQADYKVAEYEIKHNNNFSSYISLPVVPDSHPKYWVCDWPYRSEITGIETIWGVEDSPEQALKYYSEDEFYAQQNKADN